MDHKTRIETAKVRVEKAKTAKTVAETEMKQAELQKAEVIAKMAELGVTPETIDAEIAKLEKEIEDNLTKAESLIPAI